MKTCPKCLNPIIGDAYVKQAGSIRCLPCVNKTRRIRQEKIKRTSYRDYSKMINHMEKEGQL